MQQRLSDDERYAAVEDDREREDLFNEFVVELARKEVRFKSMFVAASFSYTCRGGAATA